MSNDEMMRLLYLSLLAAAIGGSYVVSQRRNLGKMMQQAAIWALIFIGVIGAVGMWGPVSQTVNPRQSVLSDGDIRVPRAADGHYYLTLQVNDVPVPFVIDTGASQIVLSQQDAKRIGLNLAELRYLGRANTANGTVQTANVRLDNVRLGPLVDTNVPAVVNQGEMEGSLLGMSYLGAFRSIQIQDNAMVLSR